MKNQPTLLSSCARAATAAEARYRINAPEPAARNTRVVALDDGAAQLARRIAEDPWRGAHFLTWKSSTPGAEGDGAAPDARLGTADGSEAWLSDELAEADVVLMVATLEVGAEPAAVIGELCAKRGIMTAGVVIPGDGDVDRAVLHLRPYAMVLLVSENEDEDDLRELLTALRA